MTFYYSENRGVRPEGAPAATGPGMALGRARHTAVFGGRPSCPRSSPVKSARSRPESLRVHDPSNGERRLERTCCRRPEAGSRSSPEPMGRFTPGRMGSGTPSSAGMKTPVIRAHRVARPIAGAHGTPLSIGGFSVWGQTPTDHSEHTILPVSPSTRFYEFEGAPLGMRPVRAAEARFLRPKLTQRVLK